jgi:hypothetical protein
MDFPKKHNAETTTDGASFLAQAKSRHADLFQAFLLKSEDFPTLEEYSAALEKEAWQVTEAIAKASWKNGIARGQARQKREKA